MNIEFIYCIINKITNNKNIGIKREDIINFINPYFIYLHNNPNYYSHIDNLLISLQNYVDNGFLLYDNQHYYINFNSIIYKKYLEGCIHFDNNLNLFRETLYKLDNLSINYDN